MNDEQSLRRVITDYQRYVSAGDIEGYTNLFKDDVIWMPPNAQDRLGKSEVFKAEAGAFSKFKFSFEMVPIEMPIKQTWAMILVPAKGRCLKR
jgi:ketosteroid isomerase-like protein